MRWPQRQEKESPDKEDHGRLDNDDNHERLRRESKARTDGSHREKRRVSGAASGYLLPIRMSRDIARKPKVRPADYGTRRTEEVSELRSSGVVKTHTLAHMKTGDKEHFRRRDHDCSWDSNGTHSDVTSKPLYLVIPEEGHREDFNG